MIKDDFVFDAELRRRYPNIGDLKLQRIKKILSAGALERDEKAELYLFMTGKKDPHF